MAGGVARGKRTLGFGRTDLERPGRAGNHLARGVRSLRTAAAGAAVGVARRSSQRMQVVVAGVDTAGCSPDRTLEPAVRSLGRVRENRIGCAADIAAGRSLGCIGRRGQT